MSNINLESDKPQLHNRIINMFCTVCFYGASAREDDSTGRPLRQREVFLRQPPEEAVRTSGGTDPAGWRTAAPLQTQIPPSKGTIKSLQQITSFTKKIFLIFCLKKCCLHKKIKFIFYIRRHKVLRLLRWPWYPRILCCFLVH